MFKIDLEKRDMQFITSFEDLQFAYDNKQKKLNPNSGDFEFVAKQILIDSGHVVIETGDNKNSPDLSIVESGSCIPVEIKATKSLKSKTRITTVSHSFTCEMLQRCIEAYNSFFVKQLKIVSGKPLQPSQRVSVTQLVEIIRVLLVNAPEVIDVLHIYGAFNTLSYETKNVQAMACDIFRRIMKEKMDQKIGNGYIVKFFDSFEQKKIGVKVYQHHYAELMKSDKIISSGLHIEKGVLNANLDKLFS